MYGEPATVSDMPHQAPLRAISGYAPDLDLLANCLIVCLTFKNGPGVDL